MKRPEEKSVEISIPPPVFWKDWERRFSTPTTGALKYLLLNRASNGFNRCVRRISNKIYLSVPETLDYFERFCKEAP